MYQILEDFGVPCAVKRLSDGANIPFSMGNTDCAKFLKDWKDGAEVLDADGNPLPYSEEAATELGLAEAVA